MPKLKVVPKSELSIAEIKNFESKIEAALLRMALEKDLASSIDELVVRDLLPVPDLAFAASNAWTNQVAQVANAWTQDVNVRLSAAQANRCIAFYKVINRTLNPAIVATRFSLGTTGVLAVLQLEELWAEQESVGFFGPIFYTAGELIRWEHYADAAILVNAEQIGFPAMVVEPYGEQISQDPKKRVEAAKWV